jgi:hypothetical protein
MGVQSFCFTSFAQPIRELFGGIRSCWAVRNRGACSGAFLEAGFERRINILNCGLEEKGWFARETAGEVFLPGGKGAS